MYIMNPNAIARLFVAYDMCMENRWIQCLCELDEETESLRVYPRHDQENYLRFFNDSNNDVRVAVYIDNFRAASVLPCDFMHDMDKMIAHGRMINECKVALYTMYDRLMSNRDTIHSRYIDIPNNVCLGMAFNKFITHACENVWDDDENDKLYFMIKGETLPNNYGYCLEYHDMNLCIVDSKGNKIIRRSAYDLSMAFANDRIDMQEV